MAEDQSVGYGLVVSFPDQSASFVHGFEAGGIWEQIRRGDTAEIKLTTHAENRNVIARMAVSEGWDALVQPSDVPGWDFTTITKVAKAPATANPHGLRVVKP